MSTMNPLDILLGSLAAVPAVVLVGLLVNVIAVNIIRESRKP